MAAAQFYKEPYRPQFHYTPQKNWLNDPNGLVYHKGKYHLFYQYNPGSHVWGNMSWGHAVSTDLTRWTQLPDPLGLRAGGYPSENLTEAFFSGGAVSDEQNTSGFGIDGSGPLVAIFTINYPQDRILANGQHVRASTQAQAIAYSNDDGLTWTLNKDNPVISDPPAEYCDQYKDFRDPSVFWYEPDKQWVMVVALSVLHKLLIYTSPNLKDWTRVSEFGPVNAVGGKWECPNLFPLPVDGDSRSLKWVMIISVDPGGPCIGSGTQYVTGGFDGKTFTADAESIHTSHAASTENGTEKLSSGTSTTAQVANWVDYGPDFYAPISWTGVPEYGRIAIAWMSNWAYAWDTPTSPWRGAMSVPRMLELKTVNGALRLVQSTVEGFESLVRPKPLYAAKWQTIPSGAMILPVDGKALEVTMSFHAARSTGNFGIELRANEGRQTFVGYDFATARMFVDRRKTGSATVKAEFPGIYYAPLTAGHDGKISMRTLLDWSSVEVFGGQGEATITAQIFPDDEGTMVMLSSSVEVQDVELKIHAVDSAWVGAC